MPRRVPVSHVGCGQSWTKRFSGDACFIAKHCLLGPQPEDDTGQIVAQSVSVTDVDKAGLRSQGRLVALAAPVQGLRTRCGHRGSPTSAPPGACGALSSPRLQEAAESHAVS